MQEQFDSPELKAVEAPNVDAIQQTGEIAVASSQVLQPSVEAQPIDTAPQQAILQADFLSEPKQVLKDNCGKLANWLVASSAAGTITGFLKDNSTLIGVWDLLTEKGDLFRKYLREYFRIKLQVKRYMGMLLLWFE